MHKRMGLVIMAVEKPASARLWADYDSGCACDVTTLLTCLLNVFERLFYDCEGTMSLNMSQGLS